MDTSTACGTMKIRFISLVHFLNFEFLNEEFFESDKA